VILKAYWWHWQCRRYNRALPGKGPWVLVLLLLVPLLLQLEQQVWQQEVQERQGWPPLVLLLVVQELLPLVLLQRGLLPLALQQRVLL
jgi:hypothetical protein